MDGRDWLPWLGPSDTAERHPLAAQPEWAAQLWDQVWWLSVPWWRRAYWWLRGFRAPISRFYEEP